jgi:hypothetical protein
MRHHDDIPYTLKRIPYTGIMAWCPQNWVVSTRCPRGVLVISPYAPKVSTVSTVFCLYCYHRRKRKREEKRRKVIYKTMQLKIRDTVDTALKPLHYM